MVCIQNFCNIAVHNSNSKSPFETCFGYLRHLSLDFAYRYQGGVRGCLKGKKCRFSCQFTSSCNLLKHRTRIYFYKPIDQWK